MKCLSTNSNLLKNHGILTVYFQQNYPKYSLEYIYSSNENLVGFRNLYNFNLGLTIDTSFETINNDDDLSSQSNKIFYDNSRLSIGTEIWYGISNMTPGISNSIRYSTYSTYTGKPLTITLSCNPLIGLLSSTYTVKTSVNSTLCSKYDFNVYSYDSDVSFGCVPVEVEAQVPGDWHAMLDAAPAGSGVLVLTQSHTLGALIVGAALVRDDLRYVGMIGSRTKRRRFESAFRQIDIPQMQIDKLVCPIGDFGVRDKRPEIIAAFVTAEIATRLLSEPGGSASPA